MLKLIQEITAVPITVHSLIPFAKQAEQNKLSKGYIYDPQILKLDNIVYRRLRYTPQLPFIYKNEDREVFVQSCEIRMKMIY